MPKVAKSHRSKKEPEQTADDIEVIAKQRMDDKEVDSGLRAIYGDDDVDFSKLDKRSWTLSRFLSRAALFLGSISVLTWAAYFAYVQLTPKVTTNDLTLSLEASDIIPSGAQTELVFTYKNPKRTPLANLIVRAQLPDTFVIESSEPALTTPENIEWNLGAIDGEATGTIRVKGHFIAPVPSVQPIQFVSTYKPANFNSEFTLVKSDQVTIEKSIAEVTMEGPESLSASETGTFKIKVRNTSTFDLPPATLALLLPEGFFLEKTEPVFTKELPPSWEIASLPAGGESQFSFVGSFASGTGGFTPFTSTLAFTKENESIIQETKTHTVDVAAGDIRFDLTLNGSNGSTSVAPGATVSATIVIENTTNARISDASVLMDFRAGGRMPIKWSGFNYDGGTLTADGVLWGTKEIGTLEPGQKIILTPSFPTMSTLGGGDAKRLDIILHLVRGAGDLKSDLYSVYIGEKASISANLENTNDQAKHKLTITFDTPPQPLEDILISFKLGDGMSLTESPALPLGTGAYVQSTKEWKWRIPNIASDSAPIKTQILLSNTPQDWNGQIFLRAIDPDTLDELNISSMITR